MRFVLLVRRSDLLVDSPRFVQLNHQLYLVTRDVVPKLFEASLQLLGRTSVEDELPHSTGGDDRDQQRLCLLLQRTADGILDLAKLRIFC